MNLKEKYSKQVIPKMKEKFGYKNNLAVPKMEKVVINSGLNVNQTAKDPKYIELVEKTLIKISGQRPVRKISKKSISGFKVKEGQVVGLCVTLRKHRMYDFVEKLVNVSLPRVRDFRGLSEKSVDKDGNLTIGFKEHIIFPEIDPGEIESVHGLEVTIVAKAKGQKEGLELFKLLGFPFKQ